MECYLHTVKFAFIKSVQKISSKKGDKLNILGQNEQYILMECLIWSSGVWTMDRKLT